MKRVTVFGFAILLLFAIVTGCGDQGATSISEESTTSIYEEPTSSYAELQSEIERLVLLLGDNGIPYWKKPHPIHEAYMEAMKKPENMSPTASGAVTCEYAEIWKEEMEKYYALLLEELREDHKEMLVSSQKNWESFVDEKNGLEQQIISFASGGGSMMIQISAGNYYDKYRERALHLMYLYSQINDYQGGIEYQEYLASIEND